jgi:hypothetical protein
VIEAPDQSEEHDRERNDGDNHEKISHDLDCAERCVNVLSIARRLRQFLINAVELQLRVPCFSAVLYALTMYRREIRSGTPRRDRGRTASVALLPRRRVEATACVVLGLAVASCGGAAPASQSLPLSARLPGPVTLCPPVSEVDYYLAVPDTATTRSRVFTAGKSATVQCQFGEINRSPQDSVLITYELYPPRSAGNPSGVVVHHIRDIGDWAVSFRRRGVTYVVVDQGVLDVTVAADAAVDDLLGLAEEELARVPAADRT